MKVASLLVLNLASLIPQTANAQTPTVHEAGPLRIQEPTHGTWNVVRKIFFGVVFARREAPGITDTIAYTSSYAATGPLDADGLMVEAKRNVAAYFAAPNLKVVSTTFEHRNDRPYPCVAVTAKGEIVASGWPDQDLYRQMRVLICQPLGKTQFGFVIGFSYSAKDRLEANESQADTFMSGVRIAPR
jgi:hypothetical protein